MLLTPNICLKSTAGLQKSAYGTSKCVLLKCGSLMQNNIEQSTVQKELQHYE
jgi:hypothetical protein